MAIDLCESDSGCICYWLFHKFGVIFFTLVTSVIVAVFFLDSNCCYPVNYFLLLLFYCFCPTPS